MLFWIRRILFFIWTTSPGAPPNESVLLSEKRVVIEQPEPDRHVVRAGHVARITFKSVEPRSRYEVCARRWDERASKYVYEWFEVDEKTWRSVEPQSVVDYRLLWFFKDHFDFWK